jgi:hypothetical protein
MLGVSLIEVVGDADIPAVVFAFQNIDKGAYNYGFKHLHILCYISLMETTAAPTLTAAERHYEAVKRANKAYYNRKHPNPRPRGRPRKVVADPPASIVV